MSRLEDENEEKLDEGTCKVRGNIEVACKLSVARSVVFMFSSPSGHPLGVSWS